MLSFTDETKELAKGYFQHIRENISNILEYEDFRRFFFSDVMIEIIENTVNKIATKHQSQSKIRLVVQIKKTLQKLRFLSYEERLKAIEKEPEVFDALLKSIFILQIGTSSLKGFMQALNFLLGKKHGFKVQLNYHDMSVISGGYFIPQSLQIYLNRLSPFLHLGRYGPFAVVSHEAGHFLFTYLPVFYKVGKNHEVAAKRLTEICSHPCKDLFNLLEDRRIEILMGQKFSVCATILRKHVSQMAKSLIEDFQKQLEKDNKFEEDNFILITSFLGYPISVAAVKEKYGISDKLFPYSPSEIFDIITETGLEISAQDKQYFEEFVALVQRGVKLKDLEELFELVKKFYLKFFGQNKVATISIPSAPDFQFLPPLSGKVLKEEKQSLQDFDEEAESNNLVEQLEKASFDFEKEEKVSPGSFSGGFKKTKGQFLNSKIDILLPFEKELILEKKDFYELNERIKQLLRSYQRGLRVGKQTALKGEHFLSSLSEETVFNERGRRFNVKRYIRTLSNRRRNPEVFRNKNTTCISLEKFTVDVIMEISGSMSGFPIEGGSRLLAYLLGFSKGLQKQRFPIIFNFYITFTSWTNKAFIYPLSKNRDEFLKDVACLKPQGAEGFEAYKIFYQKNKPLLLFTVTDGCFAAKEAEEMLKNVKQQTFTVGAYLLEKSISREDTAEALSKFHSYVLGSRISDVENMLSNAFLTFVHEVSKGKNKSNGLIQQLQKACNVHDMKRKTTKCSPSVGM